MAAQNCQKPSVTDDHDAQQDQDAGIWRSSSQNNVTGEMDCLTAAAKKDGQAESQVSCPRTIHNPLSHFQTLVSSQTQNLLTEVKATPLVKTAVHGQGFLQPSWKGSTQFTQKNVLAIKMRKFFFFNIIELKYCIGFGCL